MTDEHRTYDRWSDNDFDLSLRPAPIPRQSEPPLSADDCCAIATIAVAAGMITNAQAPGVARTLMRCYRASLSFRFDPEDGPATFAYRPTNYDRKRLRAVAVRISAATYGHVALSRSIRDLLAVALETSAVDDDALDALGRRVLEVVVDDPNVPVHIREQAARLLRGSENASSPGASDSRDAPD